MKCRSEDIPLNLFGFYLESSLKQINARLNEVGILCCDGMFSSLAAAEKIAPRIAALYNTQAAILSTLDSIGDTYEH